MAESTKFCRQKKGAWIYIFDTETKRKKKVELELIIKSLNLVVKTIGLTWNVDTSKIKAIAQS